MREKSAAKVWEPRKKHRAKAKEARTRRRSRIRALLSGNDGGSNGYAGGIRGLNPRSPPFSQENGAREWRTYIPHECGIVWSCRQRFAPAGAKGYEAAIIIP